MLAWFRSHLALLLLVFVFLGLGFAFSIAQPFTAGLDEVAHFQFVRFIAQHGRLPTTASERFEAGYKSDLPPLFHLLAGSLGSGIDLTSPPFVKLTQDNPRLLLVVGLKNILGWRAITTEDPLQGEVLLWYLGRWVALIGGALGVGATYLLLRVFYSTYPWLALSGSAVLAFLSNYVQDSSVISYESWLGAWLAFYFLVLFATLQKPTQNWRYPVLGLLLGLAIVTKYTPLPTLPVLPLLIIWLAHHYHWSWQTASWRLILVGLGLALPLGSWLLFTEIYFNQVARLGWVSGLLSPFLASDGSDETSLRLAGFISGGQIGVTGSTTASGDGFFEWAWRMVGGIGGGGWLTWLLLSLGVVAGVGLIRLFLQAGKPDDPGLPVKLPQAFEPGRSPFNLRLWLILMIAHLALFMVLPLARFLITGQAVTGMGQHILFPAAAILILMLVQGLSAWFSPARLHVPLLIVAGACLGQTLMTLPLASPPWPIQTVPLAENEPLVATFGLVSLLSYGYEADAQTLHVTLQWRAESLTGEDYRLELTLLDDQGQPQARWLGQPFNGRYPTRAWFPGDRLRDQIILPIAGLLPGKYQVQLRWLGEGGPVAPEVKPVTVMANQRISSPPAQAEINSLNLGQVTLAPSPPEDVKVVQLQGQSVGYILWAPKGVEANLPLYKENATVVISTPKRLPDEIRLSLIGPDGQPRAAVDHVGLLYTFVVEPYFASGNYQLRFEQWAGAKLADQVDTAPLLRVQTESRQFQPGLMAHPLQANFAGQVALLGYDLPERRVQSGGSLPVTLYWQALKTVGADLITFNHLVNDKQEIWGGRDRRPHEVYSTMLWASGEVVRDSFEVQVKADAPDGIYSLLVGVYLPVGKSSVSLPLLQEGEMSNLTNVNLGFIKVGRALPDFVLPAAQPQNLFNQPFGDPPNVMLLGYDLEKSDCQQSMVNCHLSIRLYWRSEAPLPLDYTTFVHLRNAASETIAQKDQPPLNGAYPTSLWDPGEIVADKMDIPLPASWPPGDYQLVVGLYNLATGARLPIPGHPDNEVAISRVEYRTDGTVTFSSSNEVRK